MKRTPHLLLLCTTLSACTGAPGDADPHAGGTTTGMSGDDSTSFATGDGSGDEGPSTEEPEDTDGSDPGATPGDEAVCGNGEIEGDEVCDDGTANNGLYDFCNTECSGSAGYCGDGVEQAQEQCDDGNDVDGDGCNAGCIVSGTELWSMDAPDGNTIEGVVTYGEGVLVHGTWPSGDDDYPRQLWISRGDGEASSSWNELELPLLPYQSSFIADGDGWLYFALDGSSTIVSETARLNAALEIVSHSRRDASLDLNTRGRVIDLQYGPAGEILQVSTDLGTNGVEFVYAFDREYYSVDNEMRWFRTLEARVAGRIVVEPNVGFFYMSTGRDSGEPKLWKIITEGADGETQQDDILRGTDTAAQGIHFAPYAGLYMSGAASSEPHIRLYDLSLATILMTQALEVDALHGCSASDADLFCIVEDDGASQLHKYDATGALVWSKVLEGEGDYFVKANPDGTSYVWRNGDDGSTVWKLSK